MNNPQSIWQDGQATKLNWSIYWIATVNMANHITLNYIEHVFIECSTLQWQYTEYALP